MSEAPLDLERGEVTELLAEEEPPGARAHYTREQLDRDRELIRRAFELALHQERSQHQSRLQVDPPVDWVLQHSLPMCEEYQQVVHQLQPPQARQAGIEVKSKDEEKEDDPRKAPEEEAEFEEGDAAEELEEGVAAAAAPFKSDIRHKMSAPTYSSKALAMEGGVHVQTLSLSSSRPRRPVEARVEEGTGEEVFGEGRTPKFAGSPSYAIHAERPARAPHTGEHPPRKPLRLTGISQIKLAERLCEVNKEAAECIRDHARSASMKAALAKALNVVAVHLCENILGPALNDGFLGLEDLLKETPGLDCRPGLQAALSHSLELTLKEKVHSALQQSLEEAMSGLVGLLQVPLDTELDTIFEKYWENVEALVVEQEVQKIRSRQGISFSSPQQAMPKESSGATSTEKSKQQSQVEGPRPSGIQEMSSVSAGEAVGETRRDPTEKDAGKGGEEPTGVMAKELGQDTEEAAEGRQGAPSPPESLPDEEESLEGTDGSQSEDTGESSSGEEPSYGVSYFER